MLKSYRHKGIKQFAETGSKTGIQPETRKPTEKAALRSGCCHLPGQHECARVRPAPTQGRPGGALGRAGERELAALTFAFEGEDAILIDYQDYH